MTIRLLGSFVLVSGVMVSSAEGSLFVREEQKYRRCLLQQQGLVADRHMTQPLEQAQDITGVLSLQHSLCSWLHWDGRCPSSFAHFGNFADVRRCGNGSVAPDLALGTWLHPPDPAGTDPGGPGAGNC
ncbi:uncharacterized protein LOC135206278 [Macrobrachium nipponense]|uniref:uncharacterized protein LOC135206278 n=1 Tax=Macrobrachium nipponense TaxID=159736 RepID=UPI0030C85219